FRLLPFATLIFVSQQALAFWTNGLLDHWTTGLLDLVYSNSIKIWTFGL
ncbi:13227_t:CDS:1, partial [Funneliformis mosseae]